MSKDMDRKVLEKLVRELIKEELWLHEIILEEVKKYFDNTLSKLGMSPKFMQMKDPSTYYALLLELARSIYISVKRGLDALRHTRK